MAYIVMASIVMAYLVMAYRDTDLAEGLQALAQLSYHWDMLEHAADRAHRPI